MTELRQLDKVAYVRFASVYRSFQDLDEFRQEIERISAQVAEQTSDSLSAPLSDTELETSLETGSQSAK